MRTIKLIALMAAAWVTIVVSAADSTPFRLDTRIEPVEESSIDVTWNASWIGGDAGATVVIADNGTEVKRATGAGEFLYTPSAIGRHELTYTTYIDGIAQDEIYRAVVFTTVLGCNHFTTNGNACAATCTEPGYTGDWICEICGAVVEHGATIPALGHDAVETKAAKAATCTESGWTHEVRCNRCNEILEASLYIAALGHIIDEGVVTKPPTISEDGVKTYCCTRCGVAVKTEAIPRLVIEWTIAANGVLTGVSLNGATEVTIPDNVKSIGNNAFSGCDELTSVTVPNSVTNIGEGAFAKCSNLKSMILPFIGSRRGDNTGPNAVFGYIFGSENFQGATNAVSTYLTGNGTKTEKLSRYLPVSLKSVAITDESLVARGAFDQCRCLTNIVINGRVEYIGEYAFCRNALAEMNIPNGVTMISANAFYCCRGMTSVTVPNSVTNIAGGAFSGCDGLTNMVLPFIGRARRNVLPTYTIESSFGYIFGTRSYDGGVATKQNDGASIAEVVTNYIPRGLSFVTITDEVTETGARAFLNCSNLKRVILSEGMKRIRGSTFDMCSSLEEVYIPHSVTQLVGNCFYGCKSLKSIKIPASVSVINNKVFRNCAKLGSVVFEGDAPTIGTEAFYGTAPGCTIYVKRGSTGWNVPIPGTWNGMNIDYLDMVDVGEKGTVEESGGVYVVEAKDGETLTEADFSFGVAKEAYVVSISADGKSATVALNAPEVAASGESGTAGGGIEEGVSEDVEDSAGVLVSVEDVVAKYGESAIRARPTPKSGETVGALPVKTYEGLYYQAAWGDDLDTMTQGEKVQATGNTLYLGVIKQKGNKGFYKITVSEQ